MTDTENGYSEKPPYFRYSASLRIFGNITNLEEIGQTLGLKPTHLHSRGEIRRKGAEPYEHDMWCYETPVEKSQPLHFHIDALWSAIRGHKEFLLRLKKELRVDVYLAYTSDSATAGVEVPHSSLEMFTELEVPFGISIVVI